MQHQSQPPDVAPEKVAAQRRPAPPKQWTFDDWAAI